MIKRAWIKTYSKLPALSEQLLTLQSWDTASKGGPNNDWSVCTTWIVCRNKRWFLKDVWRQRVDYPALKANVLHLAKLHRAKRILIEDTSAGTAIVQELRTQISGIIGVKPDGDKQSRMAVASAIFEAGQVFFPERAPWLPDLEAELFTFPGSRHDDQCDSISQALLNSKTSPWMWMTNEDWDQLLARTSIPDPRMRRFTS